MLGHGVAALGRPALPHGAAVLTFYHGDIGFRWRPAP